MGSIISNIYDKIQEHGSWENYQEFLNQSKSAIPKMKKQPEVYEGFKLSIEVTEGDSLLTVTPDLPTGYQPATLSITTHQELALLPQLEANVPFIISHTLDGEKHILALQAQKIDVKAKYNFKTIEITQEQWDTLRFTFMSAINDRLGLTKLTYL